MLCREVWIHFQAQALCTTPPSLLLRWKLYPDLCLGTAALVPLPYLVSPIPRQGACSQPRMALPCTPQQLPSRTKGWPFPAASLAELLADNFELLAHWGTLLSYREPPGPSWGGLHSGTIAGGLRRRIPFAGTWANPRRVTPASDLLVGLSKASAHLLPLLVLSPALPFLRC